MSRYIDADALQEHEHEVTLANGAQHRCIDADIIFEIPSADVVEVRHGYWITRDVRGIETEVKCSVCGSRTYYPAEYPNIRYPDYCGDCGAKMDGERKEG